MHTALLLGLVGVAAALPSLSTHKDQSAQPCVVSPGVHVIAARGSTEAQGEGDLQSVSDLITAAVPGSDSIGVIYPAELIPYETSENEGVKNMTAMIQAYATQCPDSHMVLLGYSQGGQIVGDVLGGASYSDLPPLGSEFTRNVVAAVQFGDPAHVGGKSYDVGTGDDDGLFARGDTAALDAYADILQSWCDKNDIFCDSGLSVSVHTSEVQTNAEAAAQFVIGKANA
ncbi:MAG: hypothetical protein MMC23_009537 [Stictis urceolatum]|nr:hypothetical protein [Stictis urceolata]